MEPRGVAGWVTLVRRFFPSPEGSPTRVSTPSRRVSPASRRHQCRPGRGGNQEVIKMRRRAPSLGDLDADGRALDGGLPRGCSESSHDVSDDRGGDAGRHAWRGMGGGRARGDLGGDLVCAPQAIAAAYGSEHGARGEGLEARRTWTQDRALRLSDLTQLADRRLFHQRRSATSAQTASTTPNGQAPWRKP